MHEFINSAFLKTAAVGIDKYFGQTIMWQSARCEYIGVLLCDFLDQKYL